MAQITDASIREAITHRLQATHVQVADMSGGCGQAFTCLIVSPEFKGLNSLKRHRLTNAALKEEIAAIHAWTAKCQTPEEWERDRSKTGPSMEGTIGGQVEGTSA
ncbi:hypothetical protein E4U59_006259 [Claviceps monticola]|nr:hypothetical protein E4U59_006259 [Claviceps monticola]